MKSRGDILKEIRMLFLDLEVARWGFDKGMYDSETLWLIEHEKALVMQYLLWMLGEKEIAVHFCQSEVFEKGRLALLDDANISSPNV